MTVTTDGQVVATAGSGDKAGVYLYDKEGAPAGLIPPPESPTDVEFGGPGRSTLYITAGVSLHRIETTMTGYHVWPPRR